jgi:hypothetical protein
MPLTKPPLAPVSPGLPVTAQGWNDIVSGVSNLYDEVLAMGGAALDVSVVSGGDPVGGATVVAEPLGEGRVVLAAPPFGERKAHLLVGLTSGNWRIHVRAAGFNTEARDVELPREDPLVVELIRSGIAVPDLFGVGLRSAMTQLTQAGLDVDLAFDTTGRELPRASIPPEYDAAPVLLQQPSAGTIVEPASGVRLVVASPLRRDPVVTMPSLVGLTLDEARQVLERLGLEVGITIVRSTS